MHTWWSDVPVDVSADFVVVGSGAGGASAAVTLARSGAKVVVVEAGPWREPKDYPTSGYGAMRDLFDDWGSTITRGRAFWPVIQGRVVGGTTVINSAICVRTPGDVFRLWEREVGAGADLEQPMGRAQDEIERELSVEETAPAHLCANNELAAKGAAKLGWSGHWTRRFAKGCEGCAACMNGCRSGHKTSTNVTFVPEVLSRGGDVLSNAPVDAVTFEKGAATGVTGRFVHPGTREIGGRFRVRARKGVVVAASATHSSPLLMKSGLRHRALGHGFRAHPGTAVFGVYDDVVDLHRGATQGWSSMQFRESNQLKLETLSIPAELVVSRLQGGGTALTRKMREYRHLAMWIQVIRAETVGTVKYDWLGKPSVSYTLGRADMERFRHGMATVSRLHFAAGAKAVLPGVYGVPGSIGPDEIGKLDDGPLDPRAYFGVMSHLFGGCGMGRDPATSVVDGRGRVHGVPRLFVADASAIPTTLGVNPQLTIMSLARVWAEGWVA